MYIEPKAEVDFFSQIVGSSGGWESEIDPDDDFLVGN